MTVVYVGLAWFGGIWLASQFMGWPASVWIFGLASFLLSASLALWRGKRTLGLWLLCGAVLAAGGGRFKLNEPELDGSHVSAHNGAGVLTLTGEVVEEPAVFEGHIGLKVAAETVRTRDGEVVPADGLVLVSAARFPMAPYGARITATGELTDLQEVGSLAYQRYLERQHIFSVLPWPALEVTGQGGNPIRHAILSLRSQAQESINRILPEPQAGLLAGILLGNEDGLSREMEDDFKTTGMTHIIAISGFNIAILVGLVVWLGEPLVGRRAVFLVTFVVITLYTILVGADASVVRAAIMGLLLMISLRFLGRRTFAVAPVVVAGLLMTIANPNVLLWDAGFQLSFAATLGILLYVDPIRNWMRDQLTPRMGRDATRKTLRIVSEVVIVTMAAQILAWPLQVYHFKQFSLINPLANLLILPAQSAVMIMGGLATIAGMLYLPLGQALGWVAWLFLSYTTALVRLLADFPWATMPLRLPIGAMIGFYLLVFGITWLSRQKPERRETIMSRLRERVNAKTMLAAGAIAALLLLLWAFSLPDGKLHVAFLDVGQGDAIFIQTPSGHQVLVDGGKQPALLGERLGDQMPFWDKSLDMVVATHPDNDHVAGLPGVFERYRVEMLMTNGEVEDTTPAYELLLREAEVGGTELHVAGVGESFDFGDGVVMEVLHPAGDVLADNRNENSVSVRLAYGDFSLLLTGDAAEEAERAMVESGLSLNALVFKAGHHGSNTSSNDFFLEVVQPQIVVVSAGVDNRYGHPHPEALERAAAIGAQVLRTDELGTIEVVTDGRAMWWQASR